ncbi:transcription antitermination factor NusB [Corynebacterium sp. sy039]|uniref:transcription antitermination factor NusB n=1 Tax=Corynebacterium sp. sy039 TaxID=2599641 RepID=UPI00352E7A18
MPVEEKNKKAGAAARNFKRHGSRYKARRRAVEILFEAETRDVDPVAIVAERVELAKDLDNAVAPIADYTQVIVQGVAEELDRIDETIAAHLSNEWELSRIPGVDRAVLRVALWEMLFNEDVPLKAALVDAVELASQYSIDSAPDYINGLLDTIMNNIEEVRSRAQEETRDGDDGESDASSDFVDTDLAHLELDDSTVSADDETAVSQESETPAASESENSL